MKNTFQRVLVIAAGNFRIARAFGVSHPGVVESLGMGNSIINELFMTAGHFRIARAVAVGLPVVNQCRGVGDIGKFIVAAIIGRIAWAQSVVDPGIGQGSGVLNVIQVLVIAAVLGRIARAEGVVDPRVRQSGRVLNSLVGKFIVAALLGRIAFAVRVVHPVVAIHLTAVDFRITLAELVSRPFISWAAFLSRFAGAVFWVSIEIICVALFG